eukprot:TRINITY_DN4451_c0_g1_i1.p1 TRINITY_DN4451_c0_g1~~TRINITY_DN4451_c0_g1_i1.p1  ORF type:complete len:484 (+),score=23.94 TRINITY_DN4451_c0_g1_i1:277-1728(+)
MYQRIDKHLPVLRKYVSELSEKQLVDAEWVEQEKRVYFNKCEEAFQAGDVKMLNKHWLDSNWKGFFPKDGKIDFVARNTGVNRETLKHIGLKYSTPPDCEFNLHTGLVRILNSRHRMLDNGLMDWAIGEAMSIGSILIDGKHVRLSGQDVERGTFSHRHHVLHDQKRDLFTFTPLNHLTSDQAEYKVCNSSLSEFAVLGFELGFSMSNPHSLIMWEAQFGDFNNTAQCIIDQFISSGQDKWVRQTGLVLLLPHGYEGMGPEHSSARPERFLQMCNDDPDIIPDYLPDEFEIRQLQDVNWIIANCTTPANYFHILRRQLAMPFRKPLVVFSPKSLLRHPQAISSIDEITTPSFFKRIIPSNTPPSNLQNIIMCTGKISYELFKERERRNLIDDVPIIRIEQIAPFPYDLLIREFNKYPNANIKWVQEEPKNMGYWSYIQPRLHTIVNGSRDITYVGRNTSSSTATGNKYVNLEEQELLVKNAFT